MIPGGTMEYEWSEEEEKELMGLWFEVDDKEDAVRPKVLAIATKAVELCRAKLAPHGGTMTAEESNEWFAYIETAHGDCGPLRRHITAQGARVAELEAERDALARFKAYVHQHLDQAGVPTHPKGPHSKDGCRVGDRLDIALTRLRPSDQVADDAATIRAFLPEDSTTTWEAFEAALSRLAAGAQEAEGRRARVQDLVAQRTVLSVVAAGLTHQLGTLRDKVESVCTAMKDSAEVQKRCAQAALHEGTSAARLTAANILLTHRDSLLSALKQVEGAGKPDAFSEEWLDEQPRGAVKDLVETMRHAAAELRHAYRHKQDWRLVARAIRMLEGATTLREVRYPCSPTCTHDDAATPGHPERVKERSEEVNVSLRMTIKDAATGAVVSEGDLIPKERGEAFTGTEDDPTLDAYDAGAEAMRVACWEAIAKELEADGFDLIGHLARRLKAAIEGAAP